ncbi:endonuclease MutS2 [Eudoraea chungangensis]|uniref:endonuclease MutS2 n=1 Tax=Eudoraea chungangensis TaxID=1481905 RepID=UPI0023EACE62|nr:DNA mismatch repair protein MutS [Eudoraea chungangensis]
MKQLIEHKTLEDLEFPLVLQEISSRCNTELGKKRALALLPFLLEKKIHFSLGVTSEYLASFENDNRIPNHGFESITKEIKYLNIENTTLEVESFRRISTVCLTVSTHKKFFLKFNEYYPLLSETASALVYEAHILEQINAVVDKFGEIRDDASEQLHVLRKEMNIVRAKISQSFNQALYKYQASEFLDDIKESVVDNRRVLAVKSMYRKKVKGSVMGVSKTGSISYIEPETTLNFSRELNNLLFDEKEEIQRILNQLTLSIRPYRDLLINYQDYLAQIDITAAKAKYAKDINALLPKINQDGKLYLRNAYHPLLWLSNKRSNVKTYAQTIELDQNRRIIVISGPNAGGKSITLKTIGLLQLMLQSGILIPVHERSSVCLFQNILTDIGDNQSIENHLSTYSYRLKNMRSFLKKCNEETMFLIDEFGTGSDPELGGALAEAFLEVFYDRGAYGVITTHYANLKALADELPHATNANMLFNSKTLEPIYTLELGQPGSSFTFEVAQKNGIPYNLINKAKKKVARGKLRFDATIAKMQKERSKMAQTGNRLEEEESKAREEAVRLEKLNAKIKSKLENYQELYAHDRRMILLGNKVNTASEKYFQDKKKRVLVSELLRIVETENSKRKKKSAAEAKKARQKKAQTAQEVQKEVKIIKKKKAIENKRTRQKEIQKPKAVLKIGDRVRMPDGKAVGVIDKIEKNKAVVNYGIFTTNIGVDQLELVEKKK